MTKDMREKMNRVMGAVDTIKEKFEHSLNMFAGIADGVKYAASYVMDRRSSRRASPKRKKQEKGEEIDNDTTEE